MRYFLWRYRHEIILGGLFTLAIALWGMVLRLPRSEILQVKFFDVGQGDAIFIQTPNGNKILIDGGPDNTILERLGRELGFLDRSLDLVVLTHPDRDHIAGLIGVLDRYTVAAALTTGVRRETTDFRLWEEKLAKKHIPAVVGRLGLWAEISPSVVLAVFSPEKNIAGQRIEKTNNTGIVLKLVYGKTSYLFTADIERPVEELLVRSGLNLRAEVLKVAHHGSKTSSSENFLRAVSPVAAIISLGRRNPYGHPHSEVIERLERHGIKIFRTDLDGDAELLSNSERVWRAE